MIRHWVGWFILCLATSCGAQQKRMVLVPAPAEADGGVSAQQPKSERAAEDGGDAASHARFRFSWAVRARPKNKALAFAPDGSLAVLAARELQVLHPQTGKLLASREVCFTFQGALGFFGSSTLLVVCEDAIKRFSFPDLAYQGERKLTGRARAASFGKANVAIVFEGAPVRVYALQDWSEQAVFATDQPVSAIALSKDGRNLALGLGQGELVLKRLLGGSERRVSARRGAGFAALAFSPDGKTLFGSTVAISALWRVPDLAIKRSFRTVRGVRRAVWFRHSDIMTAGEDGLLLLRPDTGRARSIGGGRMQQPLNIAVASQGGGLCGADSGGLLACCVRAKGASTAVWQAAAPKKRAAITRGRVLGREGSKLRIKAHPGTTLPPRGARVAILKYREEALGEVKNVFWDQVVIGQVIEVRRDVIKVQVGRADLLKLRKKSRGKEPLYYDVPVKLLVQ